MPRATIHTDADAGSSWTTTQERQGVIGADAGVNLVQLNVYGD
jgi:hypothetical protein